MSEAIDTLQAAFERAVRVRPQVGGFPHLAEVLRQAGVTRYQHLVPAATSVYLTAAGPVVTQANPLVAGMAEVAPWDCEALIAALRADQAGHSTFEQFTQACWAAGVVHYDVDLRGRTCTYLSATGERYVEAYDVAEVRTRGAAQSV